MSFSVSAGNLGMTRTSKNRPDESRKSNFVYVHPQPGETSTWFRDAVCTRCEVESEKGHINNLNLSKSFPGNSTWINLCVFSLKTCFAGRLCIWSTTRAQDKNPSRGRNNLDKKNKSSGRKIIKNIFGNIKESEFRFRFAFFHPTS